MMMKGNPVIPQPTPEARGNVLLLHRRHAPRVKAFLMAQPHAYRPPYGRDRPLRLTSRLLFALIASMLAGIGLHILWDVISGALQ